MSLFPMNPDIDAHFNRAVDIVQSLPKGGPVQTSYEEKLGLYALYKQGTEGDCSIPRPGILDLLGKAKWDSWNKHKGTEKAEAKRLYVNALIKILRKHAEDENVRVFLDELESFAGLHRSGDLPRPSSPASSISSYHSSQAPPSPPENMLPPDPSLAPPDVAPEYIAPSALTSSHRSLLNFQSPPIDPYGNSPGPSHLPSRTHSLAGGRVQEYHPPLRGVTGGGGGSVHERSFRQQVPGFASASASASPLGPPVHPGPPTSTSRPSDFPLPTFRDFLSQPHHPQHPLQPPSHSRHPLPQTPELTSPYLGIHHPSPPYPPRPASASTFSHQPPQLDMGQILQQIQISLTALHERLSALERTQSLILRREERKRSWFWTSKEDDELDRLEEQAEAASTTTGTAGGGGGGGGRGRGGSTTTIMRVKRQKGGMTLRVVWYLLTAVRRATIDLSVGMMVLFVGIVVMGGGWRRARWTLGRLRARFERLIAP